MTSDHYYHYQYSPPVSPKSIPHGFKRKASLQDDEVESNSLISHSFKKLRLGKNSQPDVGKRLSLAEIAPVGVAYRDSNASMNQQPGLVGPGFSKDTASRHDRDADEDYMPLDDTADRVWVKDLNAEIAEIEAAEAMEKNGLLLSAAGREHAKIPDHLLRRNPPELPDSSAANMQVILYRDPISISVPEEEDAVRKTIIEARQRVRNRQAVERESRLEVNVTAPIDESLAMSQDYNDVDEDNMELD